MISTAEAVVLGWALLALLVTALVVAATSGSRSGPDS